MGPFDQLVQFLSNDWSTPIKYLLTFLVLPFFYINLSARVHQEYGKAWEFLANISNPEPKASRDSKRLMKKIEDEILEAFQLDFWLVLCGAIALSGIFMLSELAMHSKLIYPEAVSHYGTVEKSVEFTLSDQNRFILKSIEPRAVDTPFLESRAILNLYGLSLTFAAFYYFYILYVKMLRLVGKVRECHYI